MNFLNGTGWVLFNVVVPLVAPIALLPLLGLRRRKQKTVLLHIKHSLQDGQLFWTIIAMAATACYEAALQISGDAVPELRKDLGWQSIIWHGAVIIVSAVAVFIGVLEAEDDEAKSASNNAVRFPPIMVASLIAAIVTSVTFSYVHYHW